MTTKTGTLGALVALLVAFSLGAPPTASSLGMFRTFNDHNRERTMELKLLVPGRDSSNAVELSLDDVARGIDRQRGPFAPDPRAHCGASSLCVQGLQRALRELGVDPDEIGVILLSARSEGARLYDAIARDESTRTDLLNVLAPTPSPWVQRYWRRGGSVTIRTGRIGSASNLSVRAIDYLVTDLYHSGGGPAATPEPSTAVLVGLGLLGLTRRR